MSGHSERALEEQIERRSEQLREKRLSALDAKALMWLALVPEWTGSLAESCHFPAGEEGLDRLLDRAERLRLCEVRRERDLTGEETLRFWMPSDPRSRLLERWQAEADSTLGREVREIAGRILQAESSGQVLSRGIQRWAELAHRELDGVVTGDVLAGEVSNSLAKEDTSDALAWIFAGSALRQPLGAGVEEATARGRRQLNLHYRRIRDDRYVKHFVKRREQINELQGLLDSEENWAVHFIGPSGVGKTMLMRYVSAHHAEENPVGSSARIDFDYMDPRFPLERPARLLHELGEGLAVDLADATQEQLYRSFLETVTAAEGAAIEVSTSEPLAAIRTQEFKAALAAFAEFANALAPPVVLILDTCEELAKLHPPGEDVPSVTATFEIIEAVHEAAPGVRVIFAGRRWLTPESANLVRTKEAAPASVMSMEARPYLRMHDVRGFTRTEVVEFLEGVRGLTLEEEMLSAVFENTIDRSHAPSVGGPLGSVDEPRYSPNDVALIADWIAADPALGPEKLAAGNFDSYVEERIIKRLEDVPEALAALPAATLLEHFDGATIEPALGEEPQTRRRALAALLEQEWTHLEGGQGLNDIVIRVDRGLLPRLHAYYLRNPDREHLLDAANAKLLPHLGKLLRVASLGATPEGIDAALRLLPTEVAARGFDLLAEEVAREPNWAWAENVCGRLLSEEREPPLPIELTAPVRALYISALKHRHASVDLAPAWRTVAASAELHPDPVRSKVLSARAELGQLAAAASNGGFEPLSAERCLSAAQRLLDRFENPADLPSSLAAALESVVDAQEEKHYEIPVETVGACLEQLGERFDSDPPIQAYVLVLLGRMHANNRNWPAARRAFSRLEQIEIDQDALEQCFADWVLPASMRERVLLELLRFRIADGKEDEKLLGRCEDAALEKGGGADPAQLLSLSIQARLACGHLPEDQLLQVATFESAVESYDLTSPAHRVCPPCSSRSPKAGLHSERPSGRSRC